jgi:hypothetical protein
MHHLGDHEESVLPNRTYPRESQGGIAVSNQATTALCARSFRITRCTSICRIQGGSDPGDYQFFNELPKEVPYGYACTYIPDNSNPIRSVQQAAGGVFGMDADKQVWLTKYTTGLSHNNTYSAAGAQTADLCQTTWCGTSMERCSHLQSLSQMEAMMKIEWMT